MTKPALITFSSDDVCFTLGRYHCYNLDDVFETFFMFMEAIGWSREELLEECENLAYSDDG